MAGNKSAQAARLTSSLGREPLASNHGLIADQDDRQSNQDLDEIRRRPLAQHEVQANFDPDNEGSHTISAR